jgi:ADP-ribose pyrophosphatase
MKGKSRCMSILAEYLAFAKAHPDQFVNPSEGGIVILLGEDEIQEVEAQMAQKLEARGLPTEWARVGVVYRDQYGMILRDAVRFPGGALGTYIRFIGNVNTGPGAIVLPLYQGQVLLVRRFRHATRTWHLEIPRGSGVKDFSGEENARKELINEIGATISHLVAIGKLEDGPGSTGNPAELFLAHIEAYGAGNKHEGIAEIIPVKVPEFERMIRESEITDSFTIITFLYAKLRGLM